MKLTVFAATGGIGRHLLDQALAAGHDVTAVARNPSTLPGGVRTMAADLAAGDPATLEPAVAGAPPAPRPGSPGPRCPAHRGRPRRPGGHGGAARPTPPRHDPGDGFVMRH